jgi:hypothetical protein
MRVPRAVAMSVDRNAIVEAQDHGRTASKRPGDAEWIEPVLEREALPDQVADLPAGSLKLNRMMTATGISR